MAWLAQSVVFLAFTVILFAPGLAVSRLVGLRGLVSVGTAPALTCAIYAVLAWVFSAAGVPWRLWSVLLAVGGCAVLVWLAGRVGASAPGAASGVPGNGSSRPTPDDDGRSDRTWSRWIVVVLVASSAVAIVPVALGMGAPGAPLQQWDAVFHLNGVALIRETGIASNVDGLYGAGRSVYYPTVWHSMVALVPTLPGVAAAGAAVTAAANGSTLVIASIGWATGIGALAAAIFPRRRAVAVVTIAVSGAFSMFPTVPLSTLAQWPNALSVMLVPGAAALVVAALRGARRPDASQEAAAEAPRRAGDVSARVALVLAAAGALGVASAHGSGVAGLGVIVAPLVLVVVGRAVRDAWRRGRRTLLIAAGGVLAVVVVVLGYVVLNSSVLKVLFSFERLPQRGYPASVVRTLLDTILSAWPGNVVVSAAVVVGACVLVRQRTDRWLLVSAGSVIVLVALATGPVTPLRGLTGIWYTQGARIEALYPVVATVIAAVGIVAVARWAAARRSAQDGADGGRTARHVTVLLVASLLLSAGFQAPQRAARFAEAYEPGRITWGTMLSEDELRLVRELPQLVPPDAVIIGDPHNGTPFALSMADRRVVFPQLGTSAMDDAQTYLRAHFRDIATDPQVCEHLVDLGVTHFYEDRAGRSDGAKVDPDSPGLRDVDTSSGFELVTSRGTARLWEITACG